MVGFADFAVVADVDDVTFVAFNDSLFDMAGSFRLSSAGVRRGPNDGGAALAAVGARGLGTGIGAWAAD